MQFPKKILVIKELTFILPHDFSGSLTDALQEYINYRELNLQNIHIVDIQNTKSTLDVTMSDNESKSCILYGIIEIDENGKYTIVESSGDIPNI